MALLKWYFSFILASATVRYDSAFANPENVTIGKLPMDKDVTYKVTFTNNWSMTNHPILYPEDEAHWSPPVLASHSDEYQMWAPGVLATTGVQDVAEFGDYEELVEEIDDAEDAVKEYVVGEEQFNLEQQEQTLEISLSSETPFVSMMTMIAPSPDWFSGFHDVKPVSENNTWYDSFQLALYPYDAGTDSGTTYTSDDDETDPQMPVFRIDAENSPETVFLKDGVVLPVAFVSFERVIDDKIENGPVVENIIMGDVDVTTPVEYDLTFVNNWTGENHPVDYPSRSAHWSPPVLAAHSENYTMWSIGSVATKGVKQVAETGNTREIRTELVNAGDDVSNFIVGGDQFGEKQTIFGLKMDEENQFLSLISMIAPSPDWFSGISSLRPVSDAGKWYDAFTVVLTPHDAGTDSGNTYGTRNDPTTPPVSIFEITVEAVPNSVFVNEGEIKPVAFAVFQRVVQETERASLRGSTP